MSNWGEGSVSVILKYFARVPHNYNYNYLPSCLKYISKYISVIGCMAK